MPTLRPAMLASLIFALPHMSFAQTSPMTHTDGMVHDPNMTMQMDGQMDGQMGAMMGAKMPGEPGQGGFAAISEIVSLLAKDPDTDWAVVNIDGLRDHLVDMDMLITDTAVTSSEIPGGLEISISTSGRGGAAVMRMVPAHGPVLTGETGWDTDVQEQGDRLIWRVTSDSDEAMIRALGFYGLMASGDHHRQHHMALASGKPMH